MFLTVHSGNSRPDIALWECGIVLCCYTLLHGCYYLCCRSIEEFVHTVLEILDTPAKMTLWSFILPLLPSSHKQYVQERVEIPENTLNYTTTPNQLSPRGGTTNQMSPRGGTTNQMSPRHGRYSPTAASSTHLSSKWCKVFTI